MKFPISILAASLAIAVTAPLHAAETDPVGVVKKQIAAPEGTGKAITLLSMPLLQPASDLNGRNIGQIDSVTAATITDADAGWTPGELSVEAAPTLIKITSGNAEGLVFCISTDTPNTADTLTLDSSETLNFDLTTLGIAQGDGYEIFQGDTIRSAFGDPATSGIVGGESVDEADSIQMLVNGFWETFFFKNSQNEWVRFARGTPPADTHKIKPETGILFSRIGADPLNFELIGEVPVTDSKSLVRGAGVTMLGSTWPVDSNLLNSGIQNIPGWQAGPDANSADNVEMRVNGFWERFWWDGTNWRKSTRSAPIADTEPPFSAADAILLNKKFTTSNAVLSQERPYTLGSN